MLLCVTFPYLNTYSQLSQVETSEQIQDRHTAYLFKRMYPFHRFPEKQYNSALKEILRFYQQEQMKASHPLSYQWTPLGPYEQAGRCISIVARDKNEWYVGTAAAGVWRTTDAGSTWFMLRPDGLPTYAIGAIYLKGDTLYAGTGEPNFAYRNYLGQGLYFLDLKRGKKWEVRYPFPGESFTVLANPTIFSTTNNLYKVQNGIPVPILTGVITDFAPHPFDSAVIVAVKGSPFGNSQNGVYVSTDFGNTWAKRGTNLPNDFGRAEVAWTPDGKKLYVLIANTQGGLSGLFVSRDSGKSFLQVQTVPADLFGHNPVSGQGWYDITLGISPFHPEHIWIGGVYLYRSTNGGQTWQKISNIHVDQHNIAFLSIDSVLIVNDGGVYLIIDSVAYYRGSGLISTQFYDIDILGSAVLGGTQDNGAFFYKNGWTQIIAGDVTRCLISKQNSNLFVISTPYGYIYRSSNQGQVWQFSGDGILYSEPAFWEMPLLQHHSNPRYFFTARTRVYRSTDYGVTWHAISPQLSTQNHPVVAMDIFDEQTVAAATLDGRVYLTRTGGIRWDDITGDSLPNRFPTTIAFHPKTDRCIVVAYSGYGVRHLWMTWDRGAHWYSLDGKLPDIPINTFVFDPYRPDSQWYIGTDFGVFYTPNAGESWQPLYGNIGIVPVTKILIDTVSRDIFVSTYGMGIWKVGRDVIPIDFSSFTVTPLANAIYQIRAILGADRSDDIAYIEFIREGCEPEKKWRYAPPFRSEIRFLDTVRHCKAGTKVRYLLYTISYDGSREFVSSREILGNPQDTAVSIDKVQNIGEEIILSYHVRKPQAINIAVFSIDGKKLYTVFENRYHPAGHFRIRIPQKRMEIIGSSYVFFCIHGGDSQEIFCLWHQIK